MNLLKSVPELEKDYAEVSRNLDAETIRIIESSPQLPGEWRGSIKIGRAHELYWQIQAFKGDSRAIMHHPV